MGSYIDRIQSRRLMIGSESARLLIILALVISGDSRSSALIVLCATSLGFVEPIFHPAEVRLLTELFTEAEMTRVNAILELSDQSMTIVGPISATLLMSFLNSQASLLMLAIVLTVSVLVTLQMPPNKVAPLPSQSGLKAVNQALNTFRHSHKLLQSAGLMFVLNVFFVGAVMPVLLKFVQSLGSHAEFNYTFLTVIQAVGLILMATWLTQHKMHVQNLLNRNLLTVLAIAVLLLFVSLSTQINTLALLFLLIGSFSAIFDVENNLLFQTASPHAEIGRMYVFKGLINVGSITFGTLLSGFVLHWLSVQQLYSSCAILLIISSLMMLHRTD